MLKKEQIWKDLKSSECHDVHTDLVLRPAWKWVSYAKELILALSAASFPSTSLSFNPLKHLAQLEQSRGDMIKCLVPTAQSPHLQCLHHQQERQREREGEGERETRSRTSICWAPQSGGGVGGLQPTRSLLFLSLLSLLQYIHSPEHTLSHTWPWSLCIASS